MIGSGLKKFAKENGMKADSVMAYGVLRGYAASMWEGAGYKTINIITEFSDAEKRQALTVALDNDTKRTEFRIGGVTIGASQIRVSFVDDPGTMGRIRSFADWFFPLLDELGATKANICCECGQPIVDEGVWLRMNGPAYYVHKTCINTIQERVSSVNTNRQEEATGSYGIGAIGAALGAVLGAIAWAVVLAAGYIASVVGLLIGFLSTKGYNLLKGKQGKAKIAILIVAVIFGVLLGTAAGTCLQIVRAMNENNIDMQHFAEMAEYVLQAPEVQSDMAKNVLLGLLFSGLGVFGLLRNEIRNVSDIKVKILK